MTRMGLIVPFGSISMAAMAAAPGTSDQGREAPRAALRVPLRFRFGPAGPFIEGEAIDLSATGLFVPLERPPRVGTMVHLELTLAGRPGPVECFGRVARVGADGGGRSGMGIQLVSVDAEATELIERLVEASLSSHPAPRG